MSHTPGPWTADIVGAHGNHAGGFSVEVDGVVICGRAGWPSHADESTANAKLIAAAPELLDALNRIAYGLECDGRTADGLTKAAAAKFARAAIQKAEGQP